MKRSAAARHDIPPLMALLEIKDASKQFLADGKEMVALQDIDLDIEENDFICLVGRSCSGKVTLLCIINGLDEATSYHCIS